MDTNRCSKREDALQGVLAITFDNADMLCQALTHPSAVNEHMEGFSESNQRLEFLGDSFIGFVVARELYCRLPHVSEGDLSEIRSAIVCDETLAQVAGRLQLGSFLHIGHGEGSSGGRQRESNLAAAMEAIIGAIVLDQGSEVAYGLTTRLLTTDILRAMSGGVAKDPKNILQELTQGAGMGTPVYRVTAEFGSDYRKVFTIETLVDGQVMGSGSGHRKVDGERVAARQAIKVLEQYL